MLLLFPLGAHFPKRRDGAEQPSHGRRRGDEVCCGRHGCVPPHRRALAPPGRGRRVEEGERLGSPCAPATEARRSGSAQDTPGKARGPGQRGPGRQVVRYVILVALGLLFVSPLLFMVSTSFKTREDATAVPPSWIPPNPTADAYTSILNASG